MADECRRPNAQDRVARFARAFAGLERSERMAKYPFDALQNTAVILGTISVDDCSLIAGVVDEMVVRSFSAESHLLRRSHN